MWTFANHDILEQRGESMVAVFAGPRRVLSTAPHNGGLRTDLKVAFNHGGEITGELKAPTYAQHIQVIAQEMGLDPAVCCGVSTGADVANTAFESAQYGSLTVSAAVTGGIDINGGRVGDPGFWHEENGAFVPVAGTINIMLFIGADLPDGTLARALVTCTEAKSAAVGELLLPSRYSQGIATGSGTDSTIVVVDPTAPVRLTDAGKHSKLGELIGRTVRQAVKRALFLQTGACPQRQCDVFRRLDRFGIRPENTTLSPSRSQDPELVAVVSLYAHLLDQLEWGMLPEPAALKTAAGLLEIMGLDPAALHRDGSDDVRARLIAALKSGLDR